MTRNFSSSQFTGTFYDILKGYFGKKEASGLKMGLLRRIDVLKGFLDKIRVVWVENRAFREVDVLKGLLGRKGAFGSKIELSGKIDFA